MFILRKGIFAYKADIVQIFTVSQSLCFIEGQVQFWQKNGFVVHVICADGEELRNLQYNYNVNIYPLPLERKRWSLKKDIISLCLIIKHLYMIKPNLVHVNTPKASFLGLIASWLVGIPNRIYEMHGLPVETAEGIFKMTWLLAEKLMCQTATHVIAVSSSLRLSAITKKLVSSSKIEIINNGSCNGIDTTVKFNLNKIDEREIRKLRKQYQLSANHPVVGFVGRLTPEKGIKEMYEAWQIVKQKHPTAILIVVGGEDLRKNLPLNLKHKLNMDTTIIQTGPVDKPQNYYALIDFLILPSYREGLGNVVLEAAAMQKPSIVSEVTGLKDTIVDGQTGLFCNVKDSKMLAQKINFYIENKNIAILHGQEARRRVCQMFDQQTTWNGKLQFYKRLMPASNRLSL